MRIFPSLLAASLAFLPAVVPAGAQEAAAPATKEGAAAQPAAQDASIDALFDALGLPRVLETMRAEGLAYGADLKTDLFPGQSAAGWETTVSDIHDVAVMDKVVRDELAARLAGEEIEPLLAFFTSELGTRIVDLEIEAREALALDGAEEAARTRYAQMREEGTTRADALAGLIEAGDLVEWNVMGAMNANYAFYSGLLDGQVESGAGGPDVSEEQILSDVWSQEEEIRLDTEQWVGAFLALAYEPLNDAEIAQYEDFSRTDPAQALNRALFGAFDVMYSQISRALGFAAATFMRGQDI